MVGKYIISQTVILPTSKKTRTRRTPEDKLPTDLSSLLRELRQAGNNAGTSDLTAFEEMDYDNESALDLNSKMGHPLFKGIPWEDYSELEIQTILKMHFEYLGYEVIWRHRIDPANEVGVDLECSRDSDGERVMVAVKKRPKKEALAQLVELEGHEGRKVYVYVGGAAQSFRDQLAKFDGKIDFWDERRLDEQLNPSGLTVELKIANSPSNDSMFKIMGGIIKAVSAKPHLGQGEPKVTAELMETLWGMKDRAVTVNQCLRMAQQMFERESNFNELTDGQVQSIVVYLLDFVYAYGLLSLKSLFSRMPPDLVALLHDVHERTAIRSNWLLLYAYRPGLMPGRVEAAYKEYEEEKAKAKKMDESIKLLAKDGLLPEAKVTNIDDATRAFRRFANWAYGLEGTIDDLYTKCVRGDVRP